MASCIKMLLVSVLEVSLADRMVNMAHVLHGKASIVHTLTPILGVYLAEDLI